MSKPRLIAFYLPQFYPTPENDEWWEPGFTEWTNVARAKPLFKGHHQPKIPQELSFYDLRVPETRLRQADLARLAGIEGFCYWHYWFGNGKRLLADVFREVVETGKPDYPFCLCWANHSWYQKTWDPTKPDRLLIEQTYPGEDDYRAHFFEMLPAFKDKRYMKMNGKLLFGIYSPMSIPDFEVFKRTWNLLAKENELKGFYFFAFSFNIETYKSLLEKGVDGYVWDGILHYKRHRPVWKQKLLHFTQKYIGWVDTMSYKTYSDIVLQGLKGATDFYPCINPNFDHSPRSANKGVIIPDSSPSKWKQLCDRVFDFYRRREHEENLVFIKAWNEWGEGNYLEPDDRFGRGWIEATREAFNNVD